MICCNPSHWKFDAKSYCGKSDISQVFQVDDILTLSEDITASERRGLGEKNMTTNPILQNG